MNKHPQVHTQTLTQNAHTHTAKQTHTQTHTHTHTHTRTHTQGHVTFLVQAFTPRKYRRLDASPLRVVRRIALAQARLELCRHRSNSALQNKR